MPASPADRDANPRRPDGHDKNPFAAFNFNFGNAKTGSGGEGLLSGLSGLIRALGELAEKGEELRKSGQFTTPDGREVSFQYGLNVRTMNSGRDVRVEPFGNVRRDQRTGETTVQPVREPVADILEEDDHVKVLLEMPGIDAANVTTTVDGDLLTVEAAAGPKRFRKELMLPGGKTFDPAKTTVACHSGIVEVCCRA